MIKDFDVRILYFLVQSKTKCQNGTVTYNGYPAIFHRFVSDEPKGGLIRLYNPRFEGDRKSELGAWHLDVGLSSFTHNASEWRIQRVYPPVWKGDMTP